MASSAMPIPKRKQPMRPHQLSHNRAASGAEGLGMGACSVDTAMSSSMSRSSASSLSKSPSFFAGGMGSPASSTASECISPRRPSLLGSSFTQSEYTVINLGHSDGAPRLVTCVKSSQGFDWNQELFLPSYAAYESHDLEHKPDPVFDIVLTDEEAAAMLPQ